jgi:hypothetical protein
MGVMDEIVHYENISYYKKEDPYELPVEMRVGLVDDFLDI